VSHTCSSSLFLLLGIWCWVLSVDLVLDLNALEAVELHVAGLGLDKDKDELAVAAAKNPQISH
jgi:hypothetical protein